MPLPVLDNTSIDWRIRELNNREIATLSDSHVDFPPKPLKVAMELPGGARFFRCALQVYPFEYSTRHGKQTAFNSEAECNRAIIQRCRDWKLK